MSFKKKSSKVFFSSKDDILPGEEKKNEFTMEDQLHAMKRMDNGLVSPA